MITSYRVTDNVVITAENELDKSNQIIQQLDENTAGVSCVCVYAQMYFVSGCNNSLSTGGQSYP